MTLKNRKAISKRRTIKPFKFQPFSIKQLQVLTWWNKNSPANSYDGIICDGSVRAGKTICMVLSYIMWAMFEFDGEQFGLAGKSIGSLKRNVIGPLKKMLLSRGYEVDEVVTEQMLIIKKDNTENVFYMFGAKDEKSQDYIQGITLAGMLFDEVALMPQSFINQAIARCSVSGSKMWFNCNPNSPYHWFKLEFLDKLKEKNMLHLHFTMDDNLSLDPKIRERYKTMYSGVFFQRYILGLWVMAEGIIYDMFGQDSVIDVDDITNYKNLHVSSDYGTQNPMINLLWGYHILSGKWHCLKEYHYSGRVSSIQKTDSQYANDLLHFLEEYVDKMNDYNLKKWIESGRREDRFEHKKVTELINAIIVDPSASSYIAELKQRGFNVRKAKNDVQNGIRLVQRLITNGDILFSNKLVETPKEFATYSWDAKKALRGLDEPIKANDHCMDAIRYFCNTVIGESSKLMLMDKKAFGL